MLATLVSADTPARTALFNEIASFVHERLTSTGSHDEPATKKRRVDGQGQAQPHILNGQFATREKVVAGSGAAIMSADAAVVDPALLEIKDISVTAPQRKKYDLCFTKNFLYARAAGSSVPVQGIVYPWKDIGKSSHHVTPSSMTIDLTDRV